MALPTTGFNLMQPIVANMAALTVAMLFYWWRAHYATRQRQLRQRVAYLLWVLAEQVEEPDASLSLHG
jgi:hypothetical protein